MACRNELVLLSHFYWLLLYIVSFSIIIGRLHESLRVFSVIGNYWMFIFEYGLLLCLTVQLVMWLTPFHNIRIIGSLAVAVFFILWIFGSYFAYSPVVRHLNIVMPQRIVSYPRCVLSLLRIFI